MAASNREPSVRLTLGFEGGYSNHPSDPGGPTNFGITIAEYRRYVMPGATAADVRAMQLAEAKAIYRAKYWAPLRCDELPAGLDFAVFDYGVNSGVGRASKVLQRLLGFADDGRIDNALIVAVGERDASDLIAQLCDERLAFLRRLKTWPVFGTGWGWRVAAVRSAALIMAKSGQAPPKGSEPSVHEPPGKGIVPINARVRKVIAGGIAAAGAIFAPLAHFAGAHAVTIGVIVVGTVALAVCVLFAWRWRQRHRQEASNQ
jgi:lysozyme family protein